MWITGEKERKKGLNPLMLNKQHQKRSDEPDGESGFGGENLVNLGGKIVNRLKRNDVIENREDKADKCYQKKYRAQWLHCPPAHRRGNIFINQEKDWNKNDDKNRQVIPEKFIGPLYQSQLFDEKKVGVKKCRNINGDNERRNFLHHLIVTYNPSFFSSSTAFFSSFESFSGIFTIIRT